MKGNRWFSRIWLLFFDVFVGVRQTFKANQETKPFSSGKHPGMKRERWVSCYTLASPLSVQGLFQYPMEQRKSEHNLQRMRYMRSIYHHDRLQSSPKMDPEEMMCSSPFLCFRENGKASINEYCTRKCHACKLHVNLIVQLKSRYINWRFPKMGVPPNPSSILDNGIFHYYENHLCGCQDSLFKKRTST